MFYGFDMGGTKTELAVFDADFNPIWQKRLATPKDDYHALLQLFQRLTSEADAQFNCKGKVGVGIPGVVNQASGTVFTTNVPAAKNKPFIADLCQLLAREVKVDNDANCFALSEAWAPEFQRYPTVLGIILGTGLGGGYIVNGQAISGKNGITGEIGHLGLTVEAQELLGANIPRYRCGCGKTGCFEGYLSGPGFERLYAHFHQRELAAPEIINDYYLGKSPALQHVERYMQLLAAYLGNLLTLFDPHAIVIGGGLSNFDAIYQWLPERLPNYLYNHALLPTIAKARYGDSGGSRGAALLNLSGA
jgi:N-acetylglucosamine kinase